MDVSLVSLSFPSPVVGFSSHGAERGMRLSASLGSVGCFEPMVARLLQVLFLVGTSTVNHSLVFQGLATTESFLTLLLAAKGTSAKGLLFHGPGSLEDQGLVFFGGGVLGTSDSVWGGVSRVRQTNFGKTKPICPR